VDDIYTTGSTIEACSRVLKAAGVEEVMPVCVCIGQN
jgi:predicted amidophosphoribosyltransferase